MLPMPQERFKIIINVLVEKNIQEGYDEAAEDARREEEAKRTDKTKARTVPYRAFKLHYLEVDYNFYGMSNELYQAASDYLHIPTESIDLFIQYKQDDYGVGVSLSELFE